MIGIPTFCLILSPRKDGARTEQGGYAKLAHLINGAAGLGGKRTLLVDAGDFSMGTPFHTAFMTERPNSVSWEKWATRF